MPLKRAASVAAMSSPPAKRTPPSTNKKNLGNDIAHQANKDALDEIVRLLKEDTMQILPVLQLIRSGRVSQSIAATNKTTADDEFWPNTYIRLVKLPKYWRSAVLSERCKSLDEASLETLEVKSPGAISQIFVFVSGIRESWAFPPVRRTSACARRFYRSRSKASAGPPPS